MSKTCPECGSTNIVASRRLAAHRHCKTCMYSWIPDLMADLEQSLSSLPSRETRLASETDQPKET